MSDTADPANVIIRPPIAWALAVLAALALQWLMPLPFMPAAAPAGWVGGAVFAIALALAAWAIATLTPAGSNVPTSTDAEGGREGAQCASARAMARGGCGTHSG